MNAIFDPTNYDPATDNFDPTALYYDDGEDRNLLRETLKTLWLNSKTPVDVLWVGCVMGCHAMTWDAFAVIANLNYYVSFGGAEIKIDLVVVGSDWWLERAEYDGSEWWEFKTLPTRQNNPMMFNQSWLKPEKYHNEPCEHTINVV